MRGVASFTDAWIETDNNYINGMRGESHLLQMRGLKLLMSIDLWRKKSVASFTDAWIETGRDWKNLRTDGVASFTDAWIETSLIM